MSTTAIITLSIEAKGEIVSSNFAEFAAMVRSRLAEINRNLATDEDFDQADADAKAIAGAEAELKAAKAKALADAEQLHSLFEQIDGLSGDLAAARLDLAKQIAKRKEEVKSEIVTEALESIDIDPALRKRTYLEGLQSAIKGKRTVESMRKAVGVMTACYKAAIVKTAEVLDRYERVYGADSLPDRRELSVQDAAQVEAELRRRIDLRRANEDKAKAEKEAADARAAAAKAQAQLAEANKPPLPPAGIPASKPQVSDPLTDDSLFAAPPVPKAVTPAADTPPDDGDDEGVKEWQTFAALVFQQFGPLKAHRENLTNLGNRRAAKEFAEAVNLAATNAGLVAAYQAWKETNQ